MILIDKDKVMIYSCAMLKLLVGWLNIKLVVK